MTAPEPSLTDMRSELIREIIVRQAVFPRMIAAGKLTEAIAAWRMRCLLATIDLLDETMISRRHDIMPSEKNR